MWFDGDASDVNNVRTPELMVLADDSIRLSAFSRLIRVDQSFAHLMYRSTCALNPIGTKFVEVYNTIWLIIRFLVCNLVMKEI